MQRGVPSLRPSAAAHVWRSGSDAAAAHHSRLHSLWSSPKAKGKGSYWNDRAAHRKPGRNRRRRRAVAVGTVGTVGWLLLRLGMLDASQAQATAGSQKHGTNTAGSQILSMIGARRDCETCTRVRSGSHAACPKSLHGTGRKKQYHIMLQSQVLCDWQKSFELLCEPRVARVLRNLLRMFRTR